MSIGLNARMERGWDALTIHAVVWPCGDLDTQRLTEACLSVVRAAHPGSYIARQVDRSAAAAGLTPDAFLRSRRDRFVGVVDSGSREEFVDLVCDRPRTSSGLPFTCLVTAGGMGLSYSHELGDGHVLNGLMRALFTAYRGDPATVDAPTRVATDRELLGSLAGAFVRQPAAIGGSLAAALRRMRRRPPPAEGRARAAEPARREVVVVPAEELAVVDAWRRHQDPKPSSTVALLWIVSQALRRNGFPDPQPWQVMVNLRGASAEWAAVGGNLVGRVLLDVEGDTSAGAVAEQIRDETRGPGLLTQHVLKMARELVRPVARSRETGTPSRSVSPSPGLSWSDLGRHADGGYTPLIPARTRDGSTVRPEVAVFVDPYDQGIGAVANWMHGGAILTLAFGASPIDSDAVDAVMATLRGGVSRLLPDGETARRS